MKPTEIKQIKGTDIVRVSRTLGTPYAITEEMTRFDELFTISDEFILRLLNKQPHLILGKKRTRWEIMDFSD